ncbi:alpha/beta hydrolase fold domain-containing protein [uncultured Friedmanniella sp.]|uniref:alpha/beta hydrolase fold domain-containing protein n=1 Tax=uncultured Friedmanniella sp. TaxID=335381 RepID=UPI0035C9BE11
MPSAGPPTGLPLPPHLAPLPPGRPLPGGGQVLAGVPYATLPGVRPLELDLYLPPAGPVPAPVVVFLHGGGWRLGSRRSVGPAYPGPTAEGTAPTPFEVVAAAGIAVASVDYRLTGEATWPAQLDDAKDAVGWLRLRADDLGVDPARIAAWGESAGGHLAALLGLSGTVTAVAAWYPPSDLAALPGDTGADPGAPDSREAQLLGAPLAAVPELAAAASPVAYVAPGAPPFLLLHGRADRAVPWEQSERFAAALRAAHVAVDFVCYDDADHMWLGSPAAATDALARTSAFLRRQLGA